MELSWRKEINKPIMNPKSVESDGMNLFSLQSRVPISKFDSPDLIMIKQTTSYDSDYSQANAIQEKKDPFEKSSKRNSMA